MMARVSTFQVKPGEIDNVVHLAQDAVAAMKGQAKGYGGYLTMVNREASKYVGIQLWETTEDANTFAASALYRQLMAPLVPLLAGAPVTEIFEVPFKD
jgi:quinol monooxygenase YgiN